MSFPSVTRPHVTTYRISRLNHFLMPSRRELRRVIRALMPLPATHEMFVEVTRAGVVTIMHFASNNPSIITLSNIDKARRRLVAKIRKSVLTTSAVVNVGCMICRTGRSLAPNGGVVRF